MLLHILNNKLLFFILKFVDLIKCNKKQIVVCIIQLSSTHITLTARIQF